MLEMKQARGLTLKPHEAGRRVDRRALDYNLAASACERRYFDRAVRLGSGTRAPSLRASDKPIAIA